MKAATIIGAILLIVGIIVMVNEGFTYTSREKVSGHRPYRGSHGNRKDRPRVPNSGRPGHRRRYSAGCCGNEEVDRLKRAACGGDKAVQACADAASPAASGSTCRQYPDFLSTRLNSRFSGWGSPVGEMPFHSRITSTE